MHRDYPDLIFSRQNLKMVTPPPWDKPSPIGFSQKIEGLPRGKRTEVPRGTMGIRHFGMILAYGKDRKRC